MQQELIIAIGTGLGGMLGWGFADFFAKKTVDEIGSVASLVWAHIFGVVALGGFALYQFVFHHHVFIPLDPKNWGVLGFFGSLQALIYFLVYEGFRKGQLAVLSPVFASYSGLTALFSVAVLGEVVRIPLLFALATIFVGILLLNIDMQALRSGQLKIIGAPGLKEVGVAALLAAFWTVSWDQFIKGKDWIEYALLMYAFMTLAAWAISRFQKTDLKIKNVGLWKFLILIGACEVIAYLSISWGFSATRYLSIVAILSSAFSLPVMILARSFLKEKIGTIQTIGGIAIVSGIILLSLF